MSNKNMETKLKNIINYAYKNVIFYKEIAEKENINIDEIDDIKKLPIIKKKDIIEAQDKIISSEFNKDELEKLHTSGTTGIELNLYFSRNDSIHRAMIIWSEREKNCPGIMSERKAMITDAEWLESRATSVVKDMLYLNSKHLDRSVFEKYYEKMNEFQPKFIHTPPSAMYEFVRYMKNNNLQLNYKLLYVELAGEFVSEGVYNELKTFFKHAVIINYYGSVEFYSIAHGCMNNNLHIINDSVFIEVINQDAEGYGNLIITSLVNYATPLIRYDIGDIGRIVDKTCSCGKAGKIIQLKSGRTYDYYIDGERKITGDYFRKILVNYFFSKNAPENIIQFSIIQTQETSLTYNLLTRVPVDLKEIKEYLEENINNYLIIPISINVKADLNMLEKSKAKFQMYDFWK